MTDTASTSDPCHICQTGTAAALVRTLVDEPVIEVTDDCSMGPLHDVDASRPRARIAFWTELLGSCSEYANFNVEASLVLNRQVLEELSRRRGTLVIWSGSDLTEQLLRRRLHWWLRDACVTVAEVRVLENGGHNEAGASVAMHEVAALRQALGHVTVVDDPERYLLAQQWAVLREQGSVARVWDNGQLGARPYGYLDMRLMALAGNDPVLLPRLVGDAMGRIGRSDVFWRWRVRHLIALGRMHLLEGSLEAWQNAVVRFSE